MRTVKIRPTPDQARFHAMTCKYPLFVGGFGVGKSETMANQAFMDACHSSNALIGLYEPTYDLVRLIMAPRIEEKLQQYGVRYKYNKTENIIYTSNGQLGDFILRTLDNPARIVGYETYRSHIDEIDTLREEHASDAWNKIIARNRQTPSDIDGHFNRVSAYTTPEGFRFAYKRWVEGASDMYQMVTASTLSNPFLPDDYVQSLRDTYPENLIEAYINGQFVNLTSGTVYGRYDRKLNDTATTWDGKEPLHIGMDFNVGRMAAVVFVVRDGMPYAVNEFTDGFDTPDMSRMVRSHYWNETSEGQYDKTCAIYVYPDSSGKNRKSNGASTTDISILEKDGFKMRYHSTNPRVKDRVNAMNAAFCNSLGERRLFVNTRQCPTFTKKLEQQVYKNGEPEKDGTEDINDAGGYYIAYSYPIIRPTITTKIRMRR